MLIELLRNPQRTIASLQESSTSLWPWLAGYFFTAIDGLGSAHPDWNVNISPHDAEVSIGQLIGVEVIFKLIGVAVIFAVFVLLGTLLSALLWGGIYHLTARAFRGRKGFGATVKAIGCALFWPGVVGVVMTVAALTVSFEPSSPSLSPLVDMIVASTQIAVWIWAIYLVIAAIRVRHAFSWRRSTAVFVSPIVLGLVVVELGVVLLAYLVAPSPQ